MHIGRVLYWLLTGALIGFGMIGILSIGFPFLLLGLAGVIFGAIRLGSSGLWAALIGFGGLPAVILVWDVTSMPWACSSPTGAATTPNTNYYTCVDTFLGPLTTYQVMAFGFGAIALLGLVWPLLLQVWVRVHRTAA